MLHLAYCSHAFGRIIRSTWLCGLGFGTSAALAQVVWDAGAGTGNWVDANNWSTNSVPLSTDAIQFDGTTQTTIATGANRTLATLAFNAGAGAFTIMT